MTEYNVKSWQLGFPYNIFYIKKSFHKKSKNRPKGKISNPGICTSFLPRPQDEQQTTEYVSYSNKSCISFWWLRKELMTKEGVEDCLCMLTEASLAAISSQILLLLNWTLFHSVQWISRVVLWVHFYRTFIDPRYYLVSEASFII